jgi:hypothetical protein
MHDISTKFITPAIVQAGWDLQTQVREEYQITKGRVIVRCGHQLICLPDLGTTALAQLITCIASFFAVSDTFFVLISRS